MTKTLLHIGCGPTNKYSLKGFGSDDWLELRLDIDEKVKPDIIGTLTDLSGVESSSVDVVYSSHSIEHIFSHEVQLALKEFMRVLKPNSCAVIKCPDMLNVCREVSEGNLTEVIYESSAGPITPLDVIYGFGKSIKSGNEYMAHKTGFTFVTLDQALKDAGFTQVFGGNYNKYNLGVIAFNSDVDAEYMQSLGGAYF